MTKPLKMGFDLDGVLLYNPARMLRPVTGIAKKILNKKKAKKIEFYYPKSSLAQLAWRIVHWSSLYIAPGLNDIKKMSQDGSIEPYIITSRYDCLKGDFEGWLKHMNAKKYFKGSFHNKENLQPHIFKRQMIKKLDLQYFVEDNYDIVKHIAHTTKAKIIWITNPFDNHIAYKPKFMTLKGATQYISGII